MERRRRLGAGDHLSAAPLLVDVVTPGELVAAIARSGGDPTRVVVVVVEPVYGAPAVAAALDAGWGSVEIAPADGVAPIPLVSFEQPPSAEQRSGRCRVRSDDLVDAARTARTASASTVLLGAVPFARPLAARLARADVDGVVLVPAPSPTGAVTLDGWTVAGALTRVLLDELDVRDAELLDGAGVAIALAATGAGGAAAQLTGGARWRSHLARGGAQADLLIAAAVDSIATVPMLHADGDAIIATAW